ncbi:mCG141646, partial [Mus musculus]
MPTFKRLRCTPLPKAPAQPSSPTAAQDEVLLLGRALGAGAWESEAERGLLWKTAQSQHLTSVWPVFHSKAWILCQDPVDRKDGRPGGTSGSVTLRMSCSCLSTACTSACSNQRNSSSCGQRGVKPIPSPPP